jgi:hypothetical protein
MTGSPIIAAIRSGPACSIASSSSATKPSVVVPFSGYGTLRWTNSPGSSPKPCWSGGMPVAASAP